MTRPDVEVMRDLLAERVETHLASCLEVDRAGDGARLLLGLSSAECRAILTALRSTGAGRSEAEAGVLPAAMAFLDKAAGEGLMFLEDAEHGTPAMDAADLYCEIARRLGHEIDAPRMLALTAAGHQAIRALPVQAAGGAGGK